MSVDYLLKKARKHQANVTKEQPITLTIH